MIIVKQDEKKRKRGRKANREILEFSAQDAVIANTVHQLTCWGYPQRKVLEAVAKETVALFIGSERGQREDNEKQRLTSDGVRRIYELWVVRQLKTWAQKYGDEKYGDVSDLPSSFRFRPGGYMKESLRRTRPKGELDHLAKRLVDTRGIWIPLGGEEHLWREYNHLEFTPRAAQEFLKFPMTRRVRSAMNASLRKRPRGRPKKKKI